MLIASRISDASLTSERLARGGRKSFVLFFMLVSTIIACIPLFDNLFLIFLCVGVSVAFVATATSLNFTLTTDLARNPGDTGTAIGILALGGNTFGLNAPMVTGFIAKYTGSFNSAFYLAGALLCFGAFVSYVLARKPLE